MVRAGQDQASGGRPTDRLSDRLNDQLPQQPNPSRQRFKGNSLSSRLVPQPLTLPAEILREPPGQGVQGGDRVGRGGVCHAGDAGHGGAQECRRESLLRCESLSISYTAMHLQTTLFIIIIILNKNIITIIMFPPVSSRRPSVCTTSAPRTATTLSCGWTASRAACRTPRAPALRVGREKCR